MQWAECWQKETKIHPVVSEHMPVVIRLVKPDNYLFQFLCRRKPRSSGFWQWLSSALWTQVCISTPPSATLLCWARAGQPLLSFHMRDAWRVCLEENTAFQWVYWAHKEFVSSGLQISVFILRALFLLYGIICLQNVVENDIGGQFFLFFLFCTLLQVICNWWQTRKVILPVVLSLRIIDCLTSFMEEKKTSNKLFCCD